MRQISKFSNFQNVIVPPIAFNRIPGFLLFLRRYRRQTSLGFLPGLHFYRNLTIAFTEIFGNFEAVFESFFHLEMLEAFQDERLAQKQKDLEGLLRLFSKNLHKSCSKMHRMTTFSFPKLKRDRRKTSTGFLLGRHICLRAMIELTKQESHGYTTSNFAFLRETCQSVANCRNTTVNIISNFKS